MILVLWVAIYQPGCYPANNRNIFVFPGKSVQQAIALATDRDTITLHDGVYHEKIVIDKSIVLMALNSHENINSWREDFGHCGPTWINAQNAALKAPNRPTWPVEIDKRWGGLD
jgi:hypothetical protein